MDICNFVACSIIWNPPKTHLLEKELHFSSNSVVDWNNFLREVLIDWTFNVSSEKLGGTGRVVEIDEAKFGKRKYNRGRLIDGQWVFGGFERETKNLFVVPVNDRTKDSLLAVIKDKILPGTTIISDCWKAYNCLSNENFVHQTVNHSYNFVDPDTGAHTQNIERSWREVRSNVPRYGRREAHYFGYLAEFFFRRKFRDHTSRIHEIFKAIGALYDPKSPKNENE